MKNYLFTSESVSEGHPDKVADLISDAILDSILKQDPIARVAAETSNKYKFGGAWRRNYNNQQKSIIEQVVRDTLEFIGYDNTDYGIDYKTCEVKIKYGIQSPDIAQGVDGCV